MFELHDSAGDYVACLIAVACLSALGRMAEGLFMDYLAEWSDDE